MILPGCVGAGDGVVWPTPGVIYGTCHILYDLTWLCRVCVSQKPTPYIPFKPPTKVPTYNPKAPSTTPSPYITPGVGQTTPSPAPTYIM
jgi:hypothetical protein